MNIDFDVAIVGSGPAGVSAAYPLLKKGLKVLMLDGATATTPQYLTQPFLQTRQHGIDQHAWMLGKHYHSLAMQNAVSPKLRVPSLAYVFDGFAQQNHIHSDKFIAVGSLATGGLSNAWGAGVARFSQAELKKFPVPIESWDEHYNSVAKRIGISGADDDDLSSYFGVDNVAAMPVTLDNNNHDFLQRYTLKHNAFEKLHFRLGRSRIAVLTQDQGARKACNNSGNCLWGCNQGAIYSAAFDVIKLRTYTNFFLEDNVLVQNLIAHEDHWELQAQNTKNHNTHSYRVKKVFLAAGTLASTRLALHTLGKEHSVPLLSSPTAAFLVWNYRRFGNPRNKEFGLGQLSYTVDIDKNVTAFGSTFSTTGIPLAEFASKVPLSRRLAIDVCAALLSSCVVGNVFLPGHLTHAQATYRKNGVLSIEGKYTHNVDELMLSAAATIRKAFWKMGGLVLPGSFTIGSPGSDIHYAGSLPMHEQPTFAQTSATGELFGAKDLHIVDGACLPLLPEKSHTLTIMANAERIATMVAKQWI
jgi:choline dehydrogenase-like flavoprotein